LEFLLIASYHLVAECHGNKYFINTRKLEKNEKLSEKKNEIQLLLFNA
jgi:hypothetical protein